MKLTYALYHALTAYEHARPAWHAGGMCRTLASRGLIRHVPDAGKDYYAISFEGRMALRDFRERWKLAS